MNLRNKKNSLTHAAINVRRYGKDTRMSNEKINCEMKK